MTNARAWMELAAQGIQVMAVANQGRTPVDCESVQH